MPTVQCLFCQHLNPAHAAFCNECGQAVNLRPCPQCQASNDREATTCQRCGTELSAPASQAPGASVPSASNAESLLWSHTRNGGMNPALLSEMSATTNSVRRRMFLAVAALVVALIGYGASVYFYGLPAQRPQTQSQNPVPATARAVPAETPRSASATPSELPPAATLGLTDETAPSSSAPSPDSSSASAACPPAVAALGLCQPSSPPPTRQETP